MLENTSPANEREEPVESPSDKAVRLIIEANFPTEEEHKTKPISPGDFIDTAKWVFDDLQTEDAQIREVGRQIRASEMAYQDANPKYADEQARKAVEEDSLAFWKNKYPEIEDPPASIPFPNDMLGEALKLGEKRYPNLDWDRIANGIFFGYESEGKEIRPFNFTPEEYQKQNSPNTNIREEKSSTSPVDVTND